MYYILRKKTRISIRINKDMKEFIAKTKRSASDKNFNVYFGLMRSIRSNSLLMERNSLGWKMCQNNLFEMEKERDVNIPRAREKKKDDFERGTAKTKKRKKMGHER